MKLRLLVSAVSCVGAIALVGPADTFAAQSSHLYPASDTVAMSSTPLTLKGAHCTLSGGTFVIPSTGNKTGPTTSQFAARPSLTCEKGYEGSTEGQWSLTTEYGTESVAINVPQGGLKVYLPGFGNTVYAGEGAYIPAFWDNGFPGVPSAIYIYGTTLFGNKEKGATSVTFGPVLSTLTDITHPTSLPLLGP